ncbi:MAG: glyoxalase [Sphingomonadales bacterium]|nr:MAG: glyoxalase [Sphingomonadales bacterium]
MHIVVTIDVPNLDQGIAFYRDALGFEERVRPLPSFVIMTCGRAQIGLMQKDAGTRPAPGSDDTRTYERHWTPVHADFHVEDFAATLDAIKQAGGTAEQELGGGKLPEIAFCADPFGHGFCLIGPRPD